ncbi:hypothetical protein ACROYT_G040428 [Oculina patagonica]
MDRVVVCLLLGFVCNALGKHEELIVSSPEMADRINILNVGWEATVYKQFAGMDWVQAKQMLGSYGAWPKESPPKVFKQDIANDIPEFFDAREKWPGSIHAIRNQGACGSCWAFGASETLSDRFAIVSNNGVNVVLSAQQLVDCDTVNSGCKGGWPLKAWQYMRDVGLLTVQCYGAYTARDGVCKFNGTMTSQCPSGYGVPKVYRAKSAYAVAQSVEAIQTEIMTNGPVEADFTVYQDFYSYRSGVYIRTSDVMVGGHAIKMLGWGRSDQGIDYWICANSWGPSWGINGFFWIRRGSNECGIESGVTAGLPFW